MIRLAKATAIVVATLLAVAVLWELAGPVLVFVISLVVAAATRAPVDYLIRRGLPKPVALAGTYLVSFLVLAGLMVAAIYLMGGEIARATKDFKQLYDYLASHPSSMPWLQWAWKQDMPAAEDLLTVVVGNHGEQAVRLALGTAFGFIGSVVDIVFVIVLSIYWTIDRDYFERLWLSLLPLPHRVSARKLWRMLEAELGAYARSEIAQSLLAGLVLATGFRVLGLNYPTLVALVAALSWLVPWLGVIIALAALVVAELPTLILDWPGSLIPVAAATVVTVFVFMILEFGVEPRLFNRRRYNSLFIVLAVMALAETFGILGLLLGPMVAVAVQATVEHIEREQISVSESAPDLLALEQRVTEVQATASHDDFPREWKSIADRLGVLIEQARANLDESQ